MSNVKHFWPTAWLEAAMSAGFAHYKGDGQWVFINDKMREMLTDFGVAVQRAECERCALIVESTEHTTGTRESLRAKMAALIRDQDAQ